MNELRNLSEISDIINNLSLSIPEGTVQSFEADGLKYYLEKDNGSIKIELEASLPEKTFDDSSTKKIVAEYKESIKALDDDLFLEIVDELSSKLDLKEFNSLLDLESFDEDQARKLEEMIDISTDVICLHLQHKIQDMVELYEKF